MARLIMLWQFLLLILRLFPERSSITRLSVDDKAQLSKEVSSQERDLLRNKAKAGSGFISENAIPEGKTEDSLRQNSTSEEGNGPLR